MDETEDIRKVMQAQINQEKAERKRLEREYGQVWNSDQLCQDFDVKGFMAPLVVVRRKSDGKMGSLMFQHRPRFYFGWEEDRR